MSPWTLILVAHITVTFPHGGVVTKNYHEEFHAPENAMPCKVFETKRKEEFIGEQVTPDLVRENEVTAKVDTTCVEGDAR